LGSRIRYLTKTEVYLHNLGWMYKGRVRGKDYRMGLNEYVFGALKRSEFASAGGGARARLERTGFM